MKIDTIDDTTRTAADHCFCGDRRAEYNAETSAIAWPRALEFLASHVKAK